MVERGQLNLAAQCLEKASILAPEQDYIRKHLSIVKSRLARLPPEQRDTGEIFDDSFLRVNHPTGNLDGESSTNGQFIGKSDTLFLNHGVMHHSPNVDGLNRNHIHANIPSKIPSPLHSSERFTNIPEPAPRASGCYK